ncbi:hypothetical protein SJAV_19480 [Sulfurisphaera javensis]|uniref:Uncharacterized protein n=1 Tax=Sulfurisphaera javensis TaxID=2049879 RepID=A0AAT9GT53_9CREN
MILPQLIATIVVLVFALSISYLIVRISKRKKKYK